MLEEENPMPDREVQEEVDDRLNMRVNNNPLQAAGRDELMREAEFGGPASSRDSRFYFDRKELEQLLEICKSSVSGRVIIHHAGVKVRLYRSGSGHMYEAWHLIGSKAVPEAKENPTISLPDLLNVKVP